MSCDKENCECKDGCGCGNQVGSCDKDLLESTDAWFYLNGLKGCKYIFQEFSIKCLIDYIVDKVGKITTGEKCVIECGNFIPTVSYKPTLSMVQQNFIYLEASEVSGNAGLGVTTPYNDNPLLPLMAADADPEDGWVEFTIPDNILGCFNINDIAGINIYPFLATTNPSDKIASVYLQSRIDATAGPQGISAAITQFFAPPNSINNSGDRDITPIYIPVKDGKFQLRWQYSFDVNATIEDGVTYLFNGRLSGFEVKHGAHLKNCE